MAVVENVIKQALLDMSDVLITEEDPDAGKELWASEMAKIIRDAILSAQVSTTVAAGIPVATAGTAVAQTGATTTTGVGTGSLS